MKRAKARWDKPTKVMGDGRRCERCRKPVEQNMKRTTKGHALCFVGDPVLREEGW